MTPRQRLVATYAAIAGLAGIVFFAIALTHRTYAPFIWQFSWPFLDNWRNSTTEHHHELNVFWIARKIYALGAFSVLGFLLAPILPREKRIRYAALAITLFSAMIELGQARHGRVETYLSNAFDIFCGALGGAIGAIVWNGCTAIVRRMRGH